MTQDSSTGDKESKNQGSFPHETPDGDHDDSSTLVDFNLSSLQRHHQPEQLTYVANSNNFHQNSFAPTLVDGDFGETIEGSSTSFHRPGLHTNGGFNGLSAGPELNAQILNMRYNENRVSLDRAINQAVLILHELQHENLERPVFYPTSSNNDPSDTLFNSRNAHLTLVNGDNGNLETTGNGSSLKSLEKAKIDVNDDEPIPHFKLIRIDLKLGHTGQNATASLDKHAIASLLEHLLKSQVRYLLNLKDRIDDTLLKVFVTGDLNAGKLSFCNKLLRRKVLPEDQQPCTHVFCEVVDAKRANHGIEEVHAVLLGKEYNVKDELSYETYPLKALERLVNEYEKYSLIMVYVIDKRKHEELLLANGVVDVKLIDAPGLNMDLYQTTQVFLRQEEIDLVVFVVNSENHFTLSGKEFISTAAAEKRYVFIVANKFDNIKNKDKCKTKILEQVKDLSPDTYKSSSEFVHFVTSEEGGDPGDDDNDNEDNYGDEDEDFTHLEASLRKFLLDKRSMLKLLPAKSYLTSLLEDLSNLASINAKLYENEKQLNMDALNNKIAPKYDTAIKKSVKINDKITRDIENLCMEIYDSSREEITNTIRDIGDLQVIPYQGPAHAYDYAQLTQKAMIDTILSLVVYAEGQAKIKTSELVENVIALGKETLGDEFLLDKVFNSDLMFSRKRDTISRNLDIRIDIFDFFDPSFESFISWIGIPKDVQNLIGFHTINPATTLISSIPSLTEELSKMIPQTLTVLSLYSATKVLSIATVARKAYTISEYIDTETARKIITPILAGAAGLALGYLVFDIPNAFPRKRARKLRKQLLELDYPHKNAYRVSQECRQVLAYPSRQVMTNFQTSIDKRAVEKQKLEKKIADADISFRYFKGMLSKIELQTKHVSGIDLESINYVD